MDSARTFESIVIIFNPNSTGNAPELAEELQGKLKERLPYEADIVLRPTEHAGHAVDLAREAAAKGGDVLVVSVSGDGGYNEVVNGVVQANNPNAVCSVLAAGNANDHRRTVGTKPLDEAIAEGNVKNIDLLKIVTGEGGQAEYAHSYIGFGLTPVVATELEKGSKGALTEMVSVIKTFSEFEPFEMRLPDGKRHKVDSLVFANIPEMAKYATLSEAAAIPADGKFEVILFPHMPKWRVVLNALRATTQGLGDQPSVSSYEFTTLKPLPYQMDGEVKNVEAGVTVRVESVHEALPTIA